ncbi:MAG: hypothetical protein ACI4PG_06980 [Candidatus Ventricola sp.]
MQDESSLRSEVQRLIALCQAHDALQSRGGIDFVHAGYPLMYIRSSDHETLLVIVDPSAEEKRVPPPMVLRECLYQLNDAAVQQGGELLVPGQSACVYRVQA